MIQAVLQLYIWPYMHSTHYYWDGDDGNGNVDGHDEMVVMMMWMIRMLMLKEAPVYLRANNVCVSWGFQRILYLYLYLYFVCL